MEQSLEKGNYGRGKREKGREAFLLLEAAITVEKQTGSITREVVVVTTNSMEY